MVSIVVDIENTTTQLTEKYSDYSPYNPKNKLVSIGYKLGNEPIQYLFVYHTEIAKKYTDQDNAEYYEAQNAFKSALKKADIIIAHNAKYDLCWLAESGFDVDHLKPSDTMIREYVMARGRTDLSLKLGSLCEKYNVAHKKSDLVEEYLDKGIMFDAIPIEIVEEYGRADVQACYELWQAQEERLGRSDYAGLRETVDMSNEFCKVLVNMERTGISIDEAALENVRETFTQEAEDLKRDLTLLVHKVMGDTPINLDSPQQLSEVIYSRRIKEGKEDEWIKTFNIGKDARGKNLKRPKMAYQQYAGCVTSLTQTVLKTEVERCEQCSGKGFIPKVRKDGVAYKRNPKCKCCEGKGIVFKDINEIAGFKMKPTNINFTTISGFSTSQIFLEELLEQANENGRSDASEFIGKLMRLSSLSSYISNFIGGISAFKQGDVLHPNFNQCITATGRLSSTKPNLQNQPRESTFPIRRVFKSRFKDGEIAEADFKTLEFTAAVHLAEDKRGKQDILNGVDIHNQTRDVICASGEIIDRTTAKRHTFKPLYGGRTGTEAQRKYYKAFLNELYRDIGDWHYRLQEEALAKKLITLPTGRQYIFPDVERTFYGGANKYTQIVNYPVQGFATADIVPVAIIRLWNEMRSRNLRSYLVLTVHDSIVADVHPEERGLMVELLANIAKYAEEELIKRYAIKMFVPLGCEVKIGPNLMECKKVA